MLVEAGTNPDSHNAEGVTPLGVAAQEGHADAIRVLLRAKKLTLC